MAQTETKQTKNRGGVWIKLTKNGDKYLSGNIELDGVKHYFSAFKNNFKSENAAAPDFQIAQPLEDSAEVPTKPVAKTPAKKAAPKPAPVEEEEDSDLI